MKAKHLPLILGLTGGIGMGKSAVALMLRELGLPVYHADKAVHALLKKGGKAVKPVGRLFPAALTQGGIDRKKLGPIVFKQPAKLRQLEKILHPLVHQAEQEFLQKARKRKAPAAVLEIPLLFETAGHRRCDYVICVTAPKAVQKARVMRRKGMNEAKLKAILSRQWTDEKRRKIADYVINTGGSRGQTRRQLKEAMGDMGLGAGG